MNAYFFKLNNQTCRILRRERAINDAYRAQDQYQKRPQNLFNYTLGR